MIIQGMLWKCTDEPGWLAEVPLLDVMTQADSQEEVPEMVKDAIELLVDDPDFMVDVTYEGSKLFVEPNIPKKLVAFLLRRHRLSRGLTLEAVASNLKAKSLNEYAQYEQGKHMPSLEKLEQLLRAIDPRLAPYISLKDINVAFEPA